MRCGLEVCTLSNKKYAENICIWNKRVDFMAYDKGNVFTFIEIKISLSDFKSVNGHNFFGNKNYYAIPIELYDKVEHLIPDYIGIYVLNENNELENWRKCKTQKPSKLEQIDEITKKHSSWHMSRIDEQKYNLLTACNSTIRRLLDNEMYR